MLARINYKFLFATALSFALINSIDIQLPSNNSEALLDIGNEVFAKSSSSSSRSSSSSSSSRSSSSSSSSRSSSSSSSAKPSSSSSSSSSRSTPRDSSSSSSTTPSRASASRTGGRASGGSFQKPTPSQAPVRSSTTTNPKQINSPQTKPISPVRQQPVIVPRGIDVDIDIENEGEDYNPNQMAPNSSTAGSTSKTNSSSESNSESNSSNSSNSNDSSDDFWSVVIGWGIVGFIILGLSAGIVLLVYFILKQKKRSSAANEQDNDVVTVSTLQVALLGTTKGLQSELSELTLTADTETTLGLLQLLQESALVLLRNSESWTHVLASSQTVQSREEAEVLFKKLSLQKRSKFSAETLTNVGGRVNRRDAVNSDRYEASADYIVVTLLVGTADDKPLFSDVRSVETLKEALEKLGSMPSNYLMVFELLWSPQAEEDSLSYDDLLTHYTDMIQIV